MNRKKILLSALVLLTSSIQLFAVTFPEGAPHPDAFCGGRNICEYKGGFWRCLERNREGDCIRMEHVTLTASVKAQKAKKETPAYQQPEFPELNLRENEAPPLSVYDRMRNGEPINLFINDKTGEMWQCTSRDRNGRCERQIEVE